MKKWHFHRLLRALAKALTLLAMTGAASAKVISIDFEGQPSQLYSGSATTSGGLVPLAGQTGAWNALNLGATASPVTSGITSTRTASALKDGTGATTSVSFVFNTGGASFNSYDGANGSDMLGKDVAFINAGAIAWQFTGLQPNTYYFLRVFGQTDSNGNVPSNFAKFTVGASTITLTAGRNYADFTAVSDGSGVINGTFAWKGSGLSSMSGIQIQDTFDITATAGTGGSISPSGVTAVAENSTPTYTITPAIGHDIADVVLDGTTHLGPVTTYTFEPVTAAHTLSATFVAVDAHTVTASAGAHGSISPNGAVSVAHRDSQAFTITPDSGFIVADVVLDAGTGSEEHLGSVTSYTFANVQEDHTISATFFSASKVISIDFEGQPSQLYSGSATTSGGLVPYPGQTGTWNALDLGATASPVTNNITSTRTASALKDGTGATTNISFAFNTGNAAFNSFDGTNNIAITDKLGKDVAFIGAGSIAWQFTGLQPDTTHYLRVFGQTDARPGEVPYNFADFTAGGSPVKTTTSSQNYVDFTVASNGSGVINGTFAKNSGTLYSSMSGIQILGSDTTFDITATAGTGGSISPSGVTAVSKDSSPTYTITPDIGYAVADVVLDGTTSLGPVTTYTFDPVTAAHTIDATFVAVPPQSGYAAWATANSASNNPLEDSNHNGVSNGIEFFMGGTAASPATLPALVNTAGTWTWTIPYDPAALATYQFRVSDNLSGWTDIAPPDASITVLTSPDRIQFTLPAGTGKKFCQLVVTTP